MTEWIIGVLAMVACVYATSASAKLANRREYRAFRDGLAGTRLVPPRLLRPASAVLVGSEAGAGAALITATILSTAGLPGAVPVTAAALACSIALTAALTAGVTVVVRSGTKVKCACFGASAGRELDRSHVARNAGLLAVLVAALIGIALGPGKAAPAADALAIAAGIVAALLVIRFDDLVSLFAAPPGESAHREATR
jgi:hypothetical protein